jgi:hypothetical protein
LGDDCSIFNGVAPACSESSAWEYSKMNPLKSACSTDIDRRKKFDQAKKMNVKKK